MEKEMLRAEMKAKRRMLSKEEISEKSFAITNKVEQDEEVEREWVDGVSRSTM